MAKELWKDIFGYEGKYMISNLRRIKSLDYRRSGKERILKQYKNKDGYLFVQLTKCGDCKNYRTHRLVAQAFIPNPENFSEVNHIDEDKTNNCIENLEWCDRLYNCNFGTRNERRAKSKSKSVMCLETGEVFSSAKEAQEKTGIFASAIGACARHKKHYYTAGGFHWKYV